MKGRVCLCVLVLAAAAISGCAYEQKLESSLPGPPAWVVQTPPNSADRVVFVGIGIADNVLDERTARQRAMDDVRAQIAESLKSTVVKEALDVVKQKGPAHLGKDQTEASYYAEVQNRVSLAMSGVRQDAFYWEKWKIKRGIFHPAYTKYKYYVEASMSKEDYEALRQGIVRALVAEIQSGAR